MNSATVNHYYSLIFNLLNQIDISDDHLFELKVLFKDVLSYLLKEENQYFSSTFSKLIFSIDKYKIEETLSIKIRLAWKSLSKVKKTRKININRNDYNFYLHTLIELIEFTTKEDIPEEILSILPKIIESENYKYILSDYQDNLKFFNGIVKLRLKNNSNNRKKSYPILVCESEELGEIKVLFNSHWSYIYKISWKGCKINFFNFKKLKNRVNEYVPTPASLIVIEPDYLIDVTELAECFMHNGVNIYLYFLKKFIKSKTSAAAVAGNLTNYCFDELITNPNSEFEEIYEKAIKVKPMQMFALALKNPETIKEIKHKVHSNFNNLKNILSTLKADRKIIEPTFLSPEYGFQGRLDVLIEYENDPERKDIIELKSGKPPAVNFTSLDQSGKIQSSGMWHNHLVQTTIYNMLLDSTYKNRTGSSQILYSFDCEHPLRNAPNLIEKKQEILKHRNWIISIERALSNYNYQIFKSLSSDKFGEIPKYLESDLKKFSDIYYNLTEIELEYLHNYSSFIIKELQSGKLGSNSNNSKSKGFSALWDEQVIEKEKSMSVLTNLVLIQDESDFENMYLVFARSDTEFPVTSFRKGDITLLYSYSKNDEINPTKQQILKCSIKEINTEKVKISLRNKQIDSRFYDEKTRWILEFDYLDATTKSLFQSLFLFLSAEERKKKVFLGLEKPTIKQIDEIKYPNLNPVQNRILNQCIASEDYYIMQGPPGTGKTSYMLRYIVDYLFNNTDENILLLAYTNRAVDEICSAISKIENLMDNLLFLRLGNKESSEYSDNMISCLVEKYSLNSIYKMVKNCRIFVSTVSSVLSNSEIFEIKQFDTVIIDESSQLIEPQLIGIISNVKRTIMIGDEKQLPSIILQTNNSNQNNQILDKIGLRNLGDSLFERLLKICKKNQWDDSYGMLTYQARMHKDIQELSNYLFYDGKLQVFADSDWQNDKNSIFSEFSDDNIEVMLSKSRIIFIDSPIEKKNKINISESNLVNRIISTIKNVYADDFNEFTVGVISPFRLQCSQISKTISPDLRSQITIDTVERYQGSERDIIILSLALNNPYMFEQIQSRMEFEGKMIDRKLNVSITRAKKQLIILGSEQILRKDEIYKKLLEYINLKGLFIEHV